MVWAELRCCPDHGNATDSARVRAACEAAVRRSRGRRRRRPAADLPPVLRPLRPLLARAAAPGRAVRATAWRTSRPTRTRSSSRSMPCRRSARSSCRSTIRLTADDFAYIIGHRGAKVVCAHGTTSTPSTASDRRSPTSSTSWRSKARATAGSTTKQLIASASPEFEQAGDRRDRPADHQLHQRHDLAAQGRDDHPPQRLHEHRRHADAHPHDARPTRYLWTLPMFHANGWTFVWIVTAVGAQARLPATSRARARVRGAFARERASMLLRGADGADRRGQRAARSSRRAPRRAARDHGRRSAGRGDDRAASRASSAGRSPRSTG